jgi:NTE family protein
LQRDVPIQASWQSVRGSLDDQLGVYGTVIIIANIDQEVVPSLLDHLDRVVAIASPEEAQQLAGIDSAATPRRRQIELALLTDRSVAPPDGTVLARTVGANLASRGSDIAWLGRHLSRTKLGLALGAGGAKGYAHVGALYALEEAGYTVDYVAGSSIGAMVGAWLSLGMAASDIDSLMRDAFSPSNVASMFKLSISGVSSGLDTMVQVCRETTRDRTFADLVIPLIAMSVDLTTRQPAPLSQGPVWEALLASTALAGMFPPYQRGDQRLVDGVALVPVPTGSVYEAGADIAVSVNIMNRDTLVAWPGAPPPEASPVKAGARMLDALLEVMDLAQLDASTRHAALADVVVTPRFGPASWRDFHLADLFLAAGRRATEEQMASLRSLARPQPPSQHAEGDVHSTAIHA